MNIDNAVDIRDLVRMKKYLVGTVTHINWAEDGFVWFFLQDNDGDFPIVGGVGFRVITTYIQKNI